MMPASPMKIVPHSSSLKPLELPALSVSVPVPGPGPGEGSPRRRKGKNFTAEEEVSLCHSFLAVSQGPLVENGQRTASMWERVAANFNDKNQPKGIATRSARSLESKWGTIKHDVSIFVGCHASVEGSKEFAASEAVIEKALDVYRAKHPKGSSFVHLHCWKILHEVPQWCDSINNNGEDGPKCVTPIGPAKALPLPAPAIPEVSVDEERHISDRTEQEQLLPKRVRRVQIDKEAKARECALRAQARAMADMAAVSRMKAEILADQSALQLFTLPLKDVTEPDAREYLMLRRQEEIFKMRRRLQAQTAAPVDLATPAPPSPSLPEQQNLKQPITGNGTLSVCSRCERQYPSS